MTKIADPDPLVRGTDPADPDPYQNVTDPQHWLESYENLVLWIGIVLNRSGSAKIMPTRPDPDPRQ